MPVVKTCGHCKEQKHESAFFRSAKYTDELQHWCKECQRRARSGREVNRSHGGSKTLLYRHWKSMRWRCSPANQRHRKWYFDRGISVCVEWDVWETFRVWALDNGYVEGLTLDRVDNDQGYAPDNCQWITLSENVSKARRETGRRKKGRG